MTAKCRDNKNSREMKGCLMLLDLDDLCVLHAFLAVVVYSLTKFFISLENVSNIKRKFLIVYPDTWYFVRSKNVSQYSCFKDCKMVLINISKVYSVIFLQKLYYSWRTMHLSNILTFPNHRLMDSLALHIVSLLWRRPSLGVVLSQYGKVWRNKFQKEIY